jgi:hypothetical protein
VERSTHLARSRRESSIQQTQEGQQSSEDEKSQSETQKPSREKGRIEKRRDERRSRLGTEGKDGADLILEDGHARLGGYDDGADELSQKIKVGTNTELAYEVKIETAESGPQSDWMLVRITNAKGEQIDVLRRYAAADTGGWEPQTIDLSRFAGQMVYVGFHVRTDQSLLTTFYLDSVVLEGN